MSNHLNIYTMKINLGKPKISFAESNGAGANGNWTVIDTPRENTTTLDTTDGDVVEATEEGGEVVEHIEGADKYTLNFEVFVKKGTPLPFNDIDGVIQGEYAFKVEAARDSSAPSFQIDRATVNASLQYAPNDSLRVKYAVTALKPTDNSKTVKLITGANPSTVTVKDSDDSTAETISASEPDAKSMAAGAVEVVFSGSAGANMSAAASAQLIVGGNIINLVKSAGATDTTVTFTGTSSAGALTKVILDGFTVRTLPTE